jgi:hypothetical protein
MASTTEERAMARRSWPVRIFRLGEEPGDDISATTTAKARLQMVAALTREAWALSGREIPSYSRHETPVSLRPASPR